jgi:hypothetical protein
MLLAFAVAIIVIALWAGWVVRTHRGGTRVKALPIATLVAVVVFEVLAVRTILGTADDLGTVEAGNKASLLAEGISHGMRYGACAWGSVIVAALALTVLSLRAPRDDRRDAPSARVVRESRRDR